MAQVFTDIEEELDGFFEDNYVSNNAFYVEAKAQNFKAKIDCKNKNTLIAATFNEKFPVQDFNVEGKATLRSNGLHTLKGDWELNHLVQKTSLTHETNWNSNDHQHDTKVSATNTSMGDAKAQFDFHYFKGGEWLFKSNLGKRINEEVAVAGDFTWDGKKSEIRGTHFGILYQPNGWTKSWLTHTTTESLDKDTKWSEFGFCGWKNRFEATKDTTLGFDFLYNLKKKSSLVTVGVSTMPAHGVQFKSYLNSAGDLEASAKLEASKNWDLILGLGAKTSEVNGKQEPMFGVGLEGRL